MQTPCSSSLAAILQMLDRPLEGSIASKMNHLFQIVCQICQLLQNIQYR